MNSLLLSLRIVAPLFIMMALGYAIKRAGMMNETSVRQVNKVCFKIFLPLLVFLNIYNTDLKESFNAPLLTFALVGFAIQLASSFVMVMLAQKDNSRRGVMMQGMFRGNFVLFAVPMAASLFGEVGAGEASMLIAVIIPLYNAFAVIVLSVFGGGKPDFPKMLKGIATNPLIVASLAGILTVASGLKLPEFAYKLVDDIAGIATPLAFIILGASFSFGDVRGYVKELSLTLSMKLVVYPVTAIAAAVALGFRDAPLAVLMTMFAAPVAVSSFTMAQQMGGDDKLAGQIVVFSSTISIFTMFLMIFVLKELAFI